MSARADLCGGRSAMIVPTATSPKPSQFRLGLSTRDESACVRQSCCRELSIGAFWPKHSLNKLRQSMASASGRVTGFPESGVALVRDGIRMRPRVREPTNIRPVARVPSSRRDSFPLLSCAVSLVGSVRAGAPWIGRMI
jgi:hypothetical protein